MFLCFTFRKVGGGWQISMALSSHEHLVLSSGDSDAGVKNGKKERWENMKEWEDAQD